MKNDTILGPLRHSGYVTTMLMAISWPASSLHMTTCWISLAGQTFEEGRERLVTVVDFPCAIAECCDYQSDCSSHVTI